MTERVIIDCLLSIHEKIAAAMLGDTGAELKCHVCERTESVDVPQAAVYLRQGWPVCCGQTMSPSWCRRAVRHDPLQIRARGGP